VAARSWSQPSWLRQIPVGPRPDLGQVPAAFLDQVRARAEQRLVPGQPSAPVSEGRLVARATVAFFQDLDRQLPAELGPNGEPSTYDFQAFELLRIVERFATGSFGPPRADPRPTDYRVLIGTGIVVARFHRRRAVRA
jgi:hypothetical protein